MIRAQVDIFMRNSQAIGAAFTDDEAVNAFIEKLKKAALEPNGLFYMDVQDPINGGRIMHYIPNREILRFSITQFPRVPAPV